MIRRIIEWIFGKQAKPGICDLCDEPLDQGDHRECYWYWAIK